MQGSKLGRVFNESIRNIAREIKVTLTPPASPDKWLFLVGCYNSGTTLLAELLSKHDEIGALPTEGHFITDEFVKDYDIGIPRMWWKGEHLFRLTENDEGPDPVRIKKEWAMRLDRSKPVYLEKSPPNSARTRWFQKHFSNAYFVAIVRNGYAVAEGISRKGDPKHLVNSWPIEDSIMQWKRNNEVLLEDEPYLKNLKWIKYEDLAANPQEVLNDICKFVGISEFSNFDSDGKFSIHEREESVKDLNQISIDRLSPKQIEIINSKAGEMLKRFGYEILPVEA